MSVKIVHLSARLSRRPLPVTLPSGPVARNLSIRPEETDLTSRSKLSLNEILCAGKPCGTHLLKTTFGPGEPLPQSLLMLGQRRTSAADARRRLAWLTLEPHLQPALRHDGHALRPALDRHDDVRRRPCAVSVIRDWRARRRPPPGPSRRPARARASPRRDH